MREGPIQICPVPEEQQPIKEYEKLKESWLFRWATLEVGKYGQKLAMVWLWGWIISGPIASASFPPLKQPIQFLLSGGLGAGLLVVFVLVQLYGGWSYVGDRLKQGKIQYEESGWYDGQTWIKPTELLNRDRLIVSYQIEPILSRLRRTALILAICGAISSLTWLFL